ncbi:MAG: helicase [Saprospiraceae bacterium]|nr:helicase [Saprospiraceae bacterium]
MSAKKHKYAAYGEQTWEELKDFQKLTAQYVYEQLYVHGRDKMLIADEVGLGKTIVAKGVIAKAFAQFKPTKENPTFNVLYICSNQVLAQKNLKKLNFTKEEEVVDNPLNRLIYLAYRRPKDKSLLKFDSLTPATSLTISNREGSQYERAILFALLANYAPFRNRWEGLFWLLIGTVDPKNWKERTETYYSKRNEWLRPDLFNRFRKILIETLVTSHNLPRVYDYLGRKDGISFWAALMDVCKQISKKNHREFHFRTEIIVLLRKLLTRACLEYLSAELIILDEFQRFSEIIGTNDEGPKSAAIELAQAVFELEDTKVLMLSATPFKPFTNLTDEDQGENHYQELVKVLNFLMKKHDQKFWNQFEEDRRAFFNVLRNPREAMCDLKKVKSLKKRLEAKYLEGIVRTERIMVSDDQNTMIANGLQNPLPVKAEDIRDFILLDQISHRLRQQGQSKLPSPIEYSKSAPFPLSFLDGYKFKEQVDRLAKTDVSFRDLLSRQPSAWVSLEDISRYKALGGGDVKSLVPNSKLQYLLNECHQTGSWQWLWLPPTIPYYLPEEVFPKSGDFTKTLIFSSWVMVPRAVSTLVSYEVERLAISRYYQNSKEEQPEPYFTDNKQRKPRPLLTFRYDLERQTGRSMTLFTLTYPCLTFADLYDPETNLKDGKPLPVLITELANKISKQFDRLQLRRFVDKEGESDRWYWAAPVLLDHFRPGPDTEKPLALLNTLVKHQQSIHSEQYDPTEDGEVTGGNEKKHIQDLITFLKNPEYLRLGSVPDDLFEVLAHICLAAPAVAFLRAAVKLKQEPAAAVFRNAYLFGVSKLHFFNKPESITIVRSGIPEEAVFWKAVLKYCLAGNIQSSLDEYMNLLVDCEGLDKIQDIQDRISDVLSVKTVNVKVDDFDTFTGGETRKIRSHYAVDFGSQNFETESGSGRVMSILDAFNSPYRPFVLASTSIGQEGLDFHYYCRKVVHWNLPGNAIDLEQREGRVNRYKGHVIRANLARKYLPAVKHKIKLGELWPSLYEEARKIEGKNRKKCDLVPFWHVEPAHDLKIQRIVPLYPFSKDIDKFLRLSEVLTYYRLTFGQPRQEELVESFARHGLSLDEIDLFRESILINLSPTKR